MDKELRRIFTTQLLFLNEFNSISKDNQPRTNEYDDTIAYLTKNSNKKPRFYKLLGESVLHLVLIFIYYYCAVSDLYLCYCYFANSEHLNLILTCLWFYLPSLIIFCGDVKAFYSKHFLKEKKKFKFFYKSLFVFFIYAFKLNIFYARLRVMSNSYWNYVQFRDLYLMRKFFDYLNNDQLYDLDKIELDSLQKIYLTNFKIKQDKMDKFKSELEYTFAIETIFSSIPQAFLQISIFYPGLELYDKKQLAVQLLRILLCCYAVGEGAASYVQYFSSFLFDIELSDWFYVYRIVTNILFFSSRLLAITLAFIYYKIAVCVVISIHFLILFLICFFTSFDRKNSKFTNFFISFYNVCFKMLTYFEDFDLDKVYLIHYLISWIENMVMSYSFKYTENNNKCFFENFVFIYSIMSFLLSYAAEFFIVKNFFMNYSFESQYDSILNRAFKSNKIKFDSIF